MNGDIKKRTGNIWHRKKMEDAHCLISRLTKEVQRPRKCGIHVRVEKYSNRTL